MTVYLPETISLFRQAFDETCSRILQCKEDAAFFALFVELIVSLREHPLLKQYFDELEKTSATHEQEFNEAALEAFEKIWVRLWKYHRNRLKNKKKLVLIKHIITAPKEISYSPLYNRICYSLQEFYDSSPFCRLIRDMPVFFRSVQSDICFLFHTIRHLCLSLDQYFAKRKITRHKPNKKYQSLHNKIFSLNLLEDPRFKWSAEHLPSDSFSPNLQQKFFISGKNTFEIKQNMDIRVEIDPTYCWTRIQFLKKCYSIQNISASQVIFTGRWNKVRDVAWESALARCDKEMLFGLKMSLQKKIPSLLIEHRICRRDYEKYLLLLKNYIHSYLLKKECSSINIENQSHTTFPGTQKEHFVIDSASKYWSKYPLAKRDEVFKDYCMKCPASKMLGRDRWEQIIRDRKLDPRPKETIKRGLGKKTRQN